jgi:hypothetical protein
MKNYIVKISLPLSLQIYNYITRTITIVIMIMIINYDNNNVSSPWCPCSAIGSLLSPHQSCTNLVPDCRSDLVRGVHVFFRTTLEIWPRHWAWTLCDAWPDLQPVVRKPWPWGNRKAWALRPEPLLLCSTTSLIRRPPSAVMPTVKHK